MKSLLPIVVALTASVAPFAFAAPGAASPSAPVVVELFTSQGCSSCPPANANFRAIADRPDVLALSFSVTYWDYLGWKDTFAQPAFTRRQVDYERSLGHDNVFTPQIVVNGRSDVVGDDRSEIERLIERVDRARNPVLSLSGDTVAVAAAAKPAQPANVWLVHYDPRLVAVAVGRGENSGATLAHRNVVHGLTLLGTWNGDAHAFPLPPAPAGLSAAVLVQEPGGPILSALKL